MRIRHHVAARLDVLEIVEHYEKTAGIEVAKDFFAELTSYIESIADRPESFHTVRRNLRRVNLDRFPYNVIFQIVDGKTIQIITVRHNRRRSNYGLNRR